MLHLSYVNWAEPRGPLGHLLAISDSPAQDEGHIKWPSLRAELAINLISGPSGRGPFCIDIASELVWRRQRPARLTSQRRIFGVL